MKLSIIDESAVTCRNRWISEIVKISGHFGQDSTRVEQELVDEISVIGVKSIFDHLRLCGAIPEIYGHDSSEEKLYSKYTDALIAVTFRAMGLKSIVLTMRADVADVEVVGPGYSFVADAKAFRLSRTAKNQKDFKIQAMDGWKHGKPYAMVICPMYQLPSRSSQIYQQAAARNVCIFSYSHLAVLLSYSQLKGKNSAKKLLGQIFKTIESMTPSKDSVAYWTAINRTILKANTCMSKFWKREKLALLDSIAIAKEEGLKFLALEREAIMRLSHDEALKQLIKVHKIDNRIRVISSIEYNGIFETP